MGVSEKEVRNYISLTDEQVEELLHPKVHLRKGIEIRSYTNIIFKMLRDGRDVNTIFWYVKHKGFSGKDAALLSSIYYVHDNNKDIFPDKLPTKWDVYRKRYPEDITIIHKYKVLIYILTVTDEKLANRDKLVDKYIDKIRDHYPCVRFVENAFREFYDGVMGNDPGKIDEFIKKYDGTALNSFVIGLKVDTAAVKNAVIHDVSSGFVEGNNTKFKLVKRALGGRSGLSNLEKKSILAFLATTEDFSLSELLKPVIQI